MELQFPPFFDSLLFRFFHIPDAELRTDIPLLLRLGKMLNMSMVEKFLSIDYAGRGELFEGLAIWQEEGYRLLACPVISLSFAKVKAGTFADARR